MSISVYKLIRRELHPLMICAACAVLGGVYQRFGHGVYAASMTLCFLPVLGYALIDGLWPCRRPAAMHPWGRLLLQAGASALTAGMVLQGIFEIAGTDSPYLACFYIAGGTLCIAGLWLAMLPAANDAKKE